jgi:amino acid transporter
MTTVPAQAPGAAAPDAPAEPVVAPKGLRENTIGLLGSTVLGVVQTAPSFSIAVTLGLLVATVGLHSPALILLGFIPILCVTVIEREFVARDPDCGTVFVWVGRSLGPHVGWLASWGLLAATLISLANLANVTGQFFFLTLGADSASTHQAATVAVGCAWLAVATYIGVRGLEVSSRVQITLLSFGLAVLGVFTVVALVKVAAGTAGSQAIDPSLSWLSPAHAGGLSAVTSGLLLTIFLFWGWDGPAAVAEESRGGTRTPRRALVLSVVALLGFYLVVTFALQAYAGVGDKGIGLAGSAGSGDLLGTVGGAAIGGWFGTFMDLAVLTGAAACLTAAILPTARQILSMGAYRALPSAFAKVDARSGSPVAATVATGAGIAGVLVVLSLISNNFLADAIGAIVLLIAFYYTLLGIASLWFFRREAFRSGSDFLRKAAAPALATVVLGWAFVRNAKDTYASDYGLTKLLGIGGVFAIGIGTLLLGAVLMAIWNWRAPAFFRGETFAPGYIQQHRPDLSDELRR